LTERPTSAAVSKTSSQQSLEAAQGGELPRADTVPAEWQTKVMHGSVTVGEQVVMGADLIPDRYEEPKGFSLSLHMKSAREAHLVSHELAKEGRVLLPLEKTFWAERFGMVIDRFGIPWMINCEGANQPS
jgi:PhnB protein